MSNPNFVSDLVAMAKAFEELPIVQADLNLYKARHSDALEQIQRLELRLIDLKNEVDAAHAATKQVEVERDHAERMFLETDDRLNAFRRLLAGFQTEAGALIAAAEPEQKPEPAVKVGASEGDLTPTDESGQSAGFTIGDPERVTEALTVGAESAAGEPTSTDQSHMGSTDGTAPTAEPSSPQNSEAAPEVAAQPDPTPATESSSESGLHGSTQSSERLDISPHAQEEAPHPVDPTQPTDASLTDSQSTSAPSTVENAAAAVADDVGYHNEPKIDHTKHGADAWAEWDAWCARMNTRYGSGGWPPRQQAAQ